MKIHCLSLWQPWATWITQGKKTIETRRWETYYRGPLLICASKKLDPNLRSEALYMPTGMAVAVVELVDCRPMTDFDERRAMCECYPGAFAWVLGKIRPIEPFYVRGHQKLFTVEVDESKLKEKKDDDTV